MTKPIGVGVIGASPGPDSWAANSHIPALRALRGFELRAVATSRRASADAAAQAYGVEGFDDARMLIDHSGVDLVVVAVKVTQHYDLVKQALAAGKMVYSEWPLGTTLAEARTLAELAEAAGVRTVIGLQSRFAPAVLRMIWVDIVCPYSYIGMARFDQALRKFAHAGEVEVWYRAFELDPDFDRGVVLTVGEAAARKYSMSAEQTDRAERRLRAMAHAEGLPYSIERPTGNTFDIHRVLRSAADVGLRGPLTERVFRATFSGNVSVFDRESLVALAEEVGIDRDHVSHVLSGDDYANEVRAEARLAKEHGVTGVPFFLIDGHNGVSGAQSVETFAAALDAAWAATRTDGPQPQESGESR